MFIEIIDFDQCQFHAQTIRNLTETRSRRLPAAHVCECVHVCTQHVVQRRETGGRAGSSAYHARWQDPATKSARVSPLDARRAQLARDSRSSSTLSSITGVCMCVWCHDNRAFSSFVRLDTSRRRTILQNWSSFLHGVLASPFIIELTKLDISLDDARVCQSSEMSRMRLRCPVM